MLTQESKIIVSQFNNDDSGDCLDGKPDLEQDDVGLQLVAEAGALKQFLEVNSIIFTFPNTHVQKNMT